MVRDVAANLPRLAGNTTRRRYSALHLRARETSMGTSRRSRDTGARALQRHIASIVRDNASGVATVRLPRHCLVSTTDRSRTSLLSKFARYCSKNGHETLPASEGTVLAYNGFLFEEGRGHRRSVEHYLSAVRTRHLREGLADPLTGRHHIDLI